MASQTMLLSQWVGCIHACQSSNDSAWIMNLENAAERLFAGNKRALRRRMQELEEHTRGQAFRLDGQGGPLFVWQGLAEFAGVDEDGWGDVKWPGSAREAVAS